MNQYPTASGSPESPAHLLLRLPLCKKELSQEFSYDFTLPDYLPEIRKMLRVTVSVPPAESYVSAAGIEYAGTLRYLVLYTGADGQLWSAELPADYTFSVPMEVPDTCDLSMGIDAWGDSKPEMLVTRVLSPRKITVRCRLKSTARAYGWHSLEEKLSGSPHGRIERLTGESDSAIVLRGKANGIEVSDEILPDSAVDADTLRVISGEGHVFISEASSDKDQVMLRGELILKLLTTHDVPTSEDAETSAPSAPTVTQRKLPFSATVEVEGADRYCDTRGFGVLDRLSCTSENGRILIDAELSLGAECQKNQRIVFTRDIFSTGTECETVTADAAIPFALRAQNGNFTLSELVALEGSGISASDRIIDVTGDLTAETVTESNGKAVFSGNAHFHLLTQNKESGEYGFGEITLPFRYTTESAGDSTALPAVSDHDAQFEPMTIRVRNDGEKISVDAEIGVSYRTEGTTTIRVLSQAKFGEPLRKKRGRIILCYPSPNDTLWDAARKYHSAVEVIAAANGLEAQPDTKLNSVRYLVVQE